MRNPSILLLGASLITSTLAWSGAGFLSTRNVSISNDFFFGFAVIDGGDVVCATEGTNAAGYTFTNWIVGTDGYLQVNCVPGYFFEIGLYPEYPEDSYKHAWITEPTQNTYPLTLTLTGNCTDPTTFCTMSF
jgi:hypothetical protein